VNNVNVALFSAHIKPFAAHRKMNICDAVYGGREEEKEERKKAEINFHLVVVPRRATHLSLWNFKQCTTTGIFF
jgi:hypothetical protein